MFGAVSLPLERRGKGGGRVSTKVMACYKEGGGGLNGKRASFFLGIMVQGQNTLHVVYFYSLIFSHFLGVIR